jgi:hypothetical protein
MASRYDYQCPVCNGTIKAGTIPVPIERAGFPCPNCGERLKFAQPDTRVIWLCSIVISPIVACVVARGTLTRIAYAVLGIPVWFLILGLVLGLVRKTKLVHVASQPSGVGPRDVRLPDGDVSLKLTDRPRR